mmetsp:Transcript_23665/g.76077  ORF Transcript_23665/g.76077 Transcript_23665/m.76077 type:complete len:311 (+) Transcript_23665:642-1574(+)
MHRLPLLKLLPPRRAHSRRLEPHRERHPAQWLAPSDAPERQHVHALGRFRAGVRLRQGREGQQSQRGQSAMAAAAASSAFAPRSQRSLGARHQTPAPTERQRRTQGPLRVACPQERRRQIHHRRRRLQAVRRQLRERRALHASVEATGIEGGRTRRQGGDRGQERARVAKAEPPYDADWVLHRSTLSMLPLEYAVRAQVALERPAEARPVWSGPAHQHRPCRRHLPEIRHPLEWAVGHYRTCHRPLGAEAGRLPRQVAVPPAARQRRGTGAGPRRRAAAEARCRAPEADQTEYPTSPACGTTADSWTGAG